jgi:CHAT domain-containing protein
VIRILFVVVLVFFSAVTGKTQKRSHYPKTLVDATDLLLAGKYDDAQRLFQRTLTNAQAASDEYHAARAQVGLSICYMMAHQFKASVENAEAALEYGARAKDADIAVRAALNLSNVYRRMGNFASAGQTLRSITPFLPEITDVGLSSQIYIHLATEAARKRDWSRAEPLFFAGIDAALGKGDVQTAATGWNHLGHMRLMSHQLRESEAALTEAFRLRRMAGNRNLGTSYTYLGMLRIAQGDAQSARNLLDRALEYGWNGEAAARLANVYYWRAKAKAALSDVPGALADFKEAISRATEWREDILSNDDDRLSFEVGLHRMYDDYVATGMTEWLKSRDATLVRYMFEVAEEHKSASFRQDVAAGKQGSMAYSAALAEYRVALASAWRSGKSQPTDAARLKLSRVEADLGLQHAPEGKRRLEDVQRSLSADEALISFATGDSQSWMWAITRSSVKAYAIAGIREIVPIVKRYRDILENGTSASQAGTQLYSILFGALDASIQTKKDWLLSLDHGLYDIPFAALGPDEAPLILFHSLRNIVGAGLFRRTQPPVVAFRFVGAGDAIYNSADPRWRGPRAVNTTEFARLVNTGPEVLATARAWNSDRKPTILLGGAFNREALDRELHADAGVVHIAAHVVRHNTDSKEVMVGLGLGRDGAPDFLTRSDVAAKNFRVGLVTLNGCASGSGAELPGAGLVGMTRSWLLAGATAVAATYWPVADDSGHLFVDMYSEMARSKSGMTAVKAARALRSAQVAAWRARGQRGASRAWAAVFLSTKS